MATSIVGQEPAGGNAHDPIEAKRSGLTMTVVRFEIDARVRSLEFGAVRNERDRV